MNGSVFFTGATGGLGMKCVEALCARGYRVFAAGTNPERLAALGAIAGSVPVRMDVTDDESVRAARALVGGETDGLCAVVNFAGVSAFAPMAEGDAAGICERVLAVNVVGMARVNRAVFDLVLRGKGRIINCSSEAGWMTPQPFAAPYYLSKRAVEAYSDSLRREVMFLGVPVVVLQPGPFDTAMLARLGPQFDRALEETAYYRAMLTTLKPLMTREIQAGRDPQRLTRALLRAVEARRPRLRYRVGTSRQLLFLELLPDFLVDRIYLKMLDRPKRGAQ